MPPKGGNAKKEGGRAKKEENESKKNEAAAAAKVRVTEATGATAPHFIQTYLPQERAEAAEWGKGAKSNKAKEEKEAKKAADAARKAENARLLVRQQDSKGSVTLNDLNFVRLQKKHQR